MEGRTAYARSGDATIAYRVLGDGPLDFLYIGGMLSHVEVVLEEPGVKRWFERLGEFSRVILFDRRGSGLSDAMPEVLTVEQEIADVDAVLDAVGADRVALNGYATGAGLAVHYAAARPERSRALVLYAPIGRTLNAPDYDWASDPAEREERFAALVDAWGTGSNLETIAPSLGDDDRVRTWLGRLERLSLSPGALQRMAGHLSDIDVRPVLDTINVPTLILHRTDDQLVDVRHSRYLAEHIPGARLVELPGSDNLASVGDTEALAGEIEEFLTGGRRSGTVQRAMLTVLFTDIVDATGHAARLGDGRWRDLLTSQESAVREVIARFGGHEVKTIGDAFLVTFDGAPSSALRCARSIVETVTALGIELRAGLHTGECEIIGDDVGGMAVHIAARVAALAAGGEVLASGTAYGTVVGSGLDFDYRGDFDLKGVPGKWPLFKLNG
jgi:pimeloyl-ACP methyl ester carboxylesterase